MEKVVIRWNGLRSDGIIEVGDHTPFVGERIFLIRDKIGAEYRIVNASLEGGDTVIDVEQLFSPEATSIVRLEGPVTSYSK